MVRFLRYLFHKTPPLVDPTVNPDGAQFEINTKIISEFVLNKIVPIVGVTPYPLDELMLMSSALARVRPNYLFEWGTHLGKSARVFYESTRHFNIDCSIHTIDLPDRVSHIEHPGKQYGKYIVNIPQIQKHRGDGLQISQTIGNTLAANTRVMFFLDGDHSYESVFRELSGVSKNFPDASILLHDTFNQSSESGYNIGPYRAIEEVLKTESGKYQVIGTRMGLPGMTFLYRHLR
jgi:cephalosporin hydroxylase